MLLLNHLYTLVKQTSEHGKVQASIAFNRDHKIFEGHFPGHPVVPGVCMIQILREIMEVEIGSKFRIRTGDNLKFLSVINPTENPEVQVSLSYAEQESTFNINASLFRADVTFFKFKGTFEKL